MVHVFVHVWYVFRVVVLFMCISYTLYTRLGEDVLQMESSIIA